MNNLTLITLFTTILTCVGIHASEGDTKARVAQEQGIVTSIDDVPYRKELVDLILKKGIPTFRSKGKKPYLLFEDGTIVEQLNDGSTNFPASLYAVPLIDPTPDTCKYSDLLVYIAKHNDTLAVQKFFTIPHTQLSSSSIFRAIHHACAFNNATMYASLVEHSEQFQEEQTHVARRPCAHYDTCPQLLETWVDITKRKHPETWHKRLGDNLYECPTGFDEKRRNQNLAGFTYLLEQGANLESNTTLAELVRLGRVKPKKDNPYTEYIRALIKHGADPEYAAMATNRKTGQPERQKSAIELLDCQGKEKGTLREYRTILYAPHREAVAQACDFPAGTNIPNIIFQYWLPQQDLLDAAAAGKTKKLLTFLDDAYDPNNHNTGGKSALHYAAEQGNEQAVEALLAKNADHMSCENHGMNALMLAADGGHSDVVQQLLQAASPADRATMLNTRSTYTSPVTSSTRVRRRHQNDDAPRKRYRRRDGTKPTETAADYEDCRDDVSGSTALILAVRQGHYVVAHTLLQAGADKELLDNSGKSALDYAQEKKNEAMIKLLSS